MLHRDHDNFHWAVEIQYNCKINSINEKEIEINKKKPLWCEMLRRDHDSSHWVVEIQYNCSECLFLIYLDN